MTHWRASRVERASDSRLSSWSGHAAEGVAPDLEVPLDPVAVNAGDDVQLDAALAEVLMQLKTSPQIPLKSAPPMPTHVGN